MKTKACRILSITLLLFTGINAIIAGILFIIDPGGVKMGLTTTYLEHSPFSTFLIPGTVLLIINGFLNLATATYTYLNKRDYELWILLQGILLCVWIAVQVCMVKNFNPLHYIMFSIGFLLILCALILRNYNNKEP